MHEAKKGQQTIAGQSNYLHGEEYDGDDAHPGVERVEVGLLRQVVEVEDGLEPDHREQKGRDHDDGVRVLQLLLTLVAEHAVQEDA